jgi:hypothetical protein
MNAKWTKDTSGTVVPTFPGDGWNECTQRAFTEADLEAGLKVLREKPVFAAMGAEGEIIEYQLQCGRVHYRIPRFKEQGWFPVDKEPFGQFNAAELRAIADALES